MLIDLHTHTCRYSACSQWTPSGLVGAAIQSGLDGMVLTEHDALWGAEELARLRDEFPDFVLLRGIEVTVESGDHFLVYGLLQPELFYHRMPAKELLPMVRDLGGFVALAHAYRYSESVPREIFEYPVDALEAMSSNIRRYMGGRIEKLAEELNVPTIAGSDGHAGETVGMFATDFQSPISDEAQLVAALESGKYSLHKNSAKVDAANAKVAELSAFGREKLQQGYSISEISQRFGISYSFLYGLSNGWDVSW